MNNEFTYPSVEELLKWKKKQLDENAQKALAQQASEDALLADALEGLAQMQQPAHLNAIQDELQQKIAAKLPATPSPATVKPLWQQLPFQYVASTAAAVVLVVWLSFFFYQKTKDTQMEIAQNYPTSPTDSAITSSDQPAETLDSTSAVQQSTQPEPSEQNSLNLAEEETQKNESSANTKTGGKSTETLTAPTIDDTKKTPILTFDDLFPAKTESFTPKQEVAENLSANSGENFSKKGEVEMENKTAIAPAAPPSAKPSVANASVMEKDEAEDVSTKEQPSPSAVTTTAPVKAIQGKGGVSQNQILSDKSAKTYPSPTKKASSKAKQDAKAQRAETKAMEDAVVENSSSELAKKSEEAPTSVYFLQGKKLYENKNYEAAIQQFNLVPANDENRQTANYFTGMCYIELNQYEQAIAYLQSAASDKNHNYYKKAKTKLAEAKKKAQK